MHSTLALVLASLLAFTMVCAFTVQAESSGTVYINTDGSVVGTDKIQRNGDNYVFTGDVLGNLTVQRDNIVIDGAGFAVKYEESHDSFAIILDGRINVTIKNVAVLTLGSGINFNQTSNCQILSSRIDINQSGMSFRNSNGNSIIGNYMYAPLNGLMFT